MQVRVTNIPLTRVFRCLGSFFKPPMEAFCPHTPLHRRYVWRYVWRYVIPIADPVDTSHLLWRGVWGRLRLHREYLVISYGRGCGGAPRLHYMVGARNLPPFASVEIFGIPGTTTGGLM